MLLSLFAIALRQFTGAPNAQVSFLTDSQTHITASQSNSSDFEGAHFKSAEKSKTTYKHYVGPKEFNITKDEIQQGNLRIEDIVQDNHFKVKAIKIAKRANSPPLQIKSVNNHKQNLIRKGILVLENENRTNYFNWRFSQY